MKNKPYERMDNTRKQQVNLSKTGQTMEAADDMMGKVSDPGAKINMAGKSAQMNDSRNNKKKDR